MKGKDEWVAEEVRCTRKYVEDQLDRVMEGDNIVTCNRVSPTHLASQHFKNKGYKPTYKIIGKKFINIVWEDMFQERFIMIVDMDNIGTGFRVYAYDDENDGLLSN